MWGDDDEEEEQEGGKMIMRISCPVAQFSPFEEESKSEQSQ